MAGKAKGPEAVLTYNCRSAALVGTVGGRPIHCQVGRDSGVPPGRYRITTPTTHPSFGRVAVLGAEGPSGITVQSPPAGNALAGGITVQHAPVRHALAGGITVQHAPAGNALPTGITVQHTPAGNVVVSGITVQHPGGGNVLAGGRVALIIPATLRGRFQEGNRVVVLSGYEELMDALEASGGGVLQVVA
jgi:hypothetical protein